MRTRWPLSAESRFAEHGTHGQGILSEWIADCQVGISAQVPDQTITPPVDASRIAPRSQAKRDRVIAAAARPYSSHQTSAEIRKAGFPRPNHALNCERPLDLCHRLDAFGAHVLAYRSPALGNLDALDVRIELPPGRAHRETTVIAELRLLAAEFTRRHVRASSGYNDYHNEAASYHSAPVSTRALTSGMITVFSRPRTQAAGH